MHSSVEEKAHEAVLTVFKKFKRRKPNKKPTDPTTVAQPLLSQLLLRFGRLCRTCKHPKFSIFL